MPINDKSGGDKGDPKSAGETTEVDVVQNAAIKYVYDQMVARDTVMWERLSARDTQLQEKMMELFSRILDNSTVDYVVSQGFSTIADQLQAQLQPLRDMTPQRTNLSDVNDARLASLRRALARQDFSFATDDALGTPLPQIDSRSFVS